mmetsp:Transcript_4513/g.6244  ORF Transcript_4513/g.6244 Transcript_4513/m.6244 type:complete len:535 (-) Transcript_4513:107-1711(-)
MSERHNIVGGSNRTMMGVSVVVWAGVLLFFFAGKAIGQECSIPHVATPRNAADSSPYWRDPNLELFKFDLGDGPEEKLVYVPPNVSSIYRDGSNHRQAVKPRYNGLAGMFVNLSNQHLRLFWEPTKNSPNPSLIDNSVPFSSGGTATFPTHYFYFAKQEGNPVMNKVKQFQVETYPHSVYVYDPYRVEGDPQATEANLAALTPREKELYRKLRKSIDFGKLYLEKTGRSYLVNYPRPEPAYWMWPAEYLGQEHWITSKETHFVQMPPEEELSRLQVVGAARTLSEDEPRLLQDYRDPASATINMTLKVLSVAPRVFQIPDFLSSVEVEHILQIAKGEKLGRSSTGIGMHPGDDEQQNDGTRSTRTSYNSWIARERTTIIDAVYRRAADLVRIDEALLRRRQADQYPEVPSKKSISETLQLVHYNPGQEYTAHHDFGYCRIDDEFQAQRYLTLLLYLNDNTTGLGGGGSTTFPRWLNAETFRPLEIVPKVGSAALFYSQLPDGNMDCLSQHQAEKVIEGEKWLINLWIWSPVYEK